MDRRWEHLWAEMDNLAIALRIGAVEFCAAERFELLASSAELAGALAADSPYEWPKATWADEP